MIADHFTKPLQGIKFREFRNRVMGFVQDNGIHKQLPIILNSNSAMKLFFSTNPGVIPHIGSTGVC